jgi:hypothetical protein
MALSKKAVYEGWTKEVTWVRESKNDLNSACDERVIHVNGVISPRKPFARDILEFRYTNAEYRSDLN